MPNTYIKYGRPSLIVIKMSTLESGIDVGQEINVGPGKFDKKNNHRALNKGRAWKMRQK